MDWRSVNFDWNRARAFLVTAEEGSFTAAATALGSTQPTVGRQVAALEEELDVLLFERVGRGLTLTATGLDLVEHVRAMGEAATRVSLTAAGQSLSLAGLITISASEVIAAHLLPPIVAEIREAHPTIEIDIVASNQPSDLARREADIAIRSFRPTDPDLYAQKLRDSSAWLYATPRYLEKIGSPTTPAELSRGAFIGFDRSDALMKGLNALGLQLTAASFPIVTGNQLLQWEIAKQGSGICIMVGEVGEVEPLVQRALPDLPAIPVPMWLTSHRELKTSRRVRVVFEWLADALRGSSEA